MKKDTDHYRRRQNEPVLDSKGRHWAGLVFSGLMVIIILSYVAISTRNQSITLYKQRSPDPTFNLSTNPEAFYETVNFYYFVAGVFLVWFCYTGFRLLFWNYKQR